MSQIILYQSERPASTTRSVSLAGNSGVFEAFSGSQIKNFFGPQVAAPRSRNGKLPRGVVGEIRESRDSAHRSRMQEARVALAKELFSDEETTVLKLRLSRGYSQQQLAVAVGTSQSHIAKIEAGALNVYWDTVERLASALGVTLDELADAMRRTKAKAAVKSPATTPSTRA